MIDSQVQIPRQAILDHKKDDEWKEKCVDAFISLSNFSPVRGTYRYRLRQAYKFYNGIIDDADYTHVLRPYGNRRDNFPAKLHNYPIIKPVIDLLIGEKIKRPLNYVLTVENDDVTNRKQELKNETIFEAVMQRFLSEMQELGVELGQPNAQELPGLEEIEEKFEQSYRDNRAELGEKSLNYIRRECEVDRKFIEGFFHFLVSGQVMSNRKIVGEEIEYEILNPLNVDFDKSPDTKFIEDSDWALVRKLCTPSDVIDEFYDVLDKEQIDQIENPRRDRTGDYLIYADDLESDTTARDHAASRLIEVVEVYWKSRKKIGFVEYLDEAGEVQEFEVDGSYKVQEDEDVEWFWINEVWKGFRIDGDIYVDIEPVPIQRGSLDNPSKCKLPINGRKYSDENAGNISLAMMGIPYQITYNIFKYRLENAIARSKDVLAQFDINMIPQEMTMEDFMYHLEATGIAWQEYDADSRNLSPTHQGIIDMSIKVIQDYLALLQSIKEEWEALSGVSKQRQGDVGQYETRGGAEYSIIQSATITEDIFNKYAQFEEKDLRGLLDYSRYAWINGKKAHFVMPDYTQEFLELDGIDHAETEYGIYISTSQKDIEGIAALKQLSQSMMQNGVQLSTIIDIMDTTSLNGLKNKVEKAEQSQQELNQQLAQAEQEAEMAELEMEERKLQADIEKNIRDNETRIAIEEMKQQQQAAVNRDNINAEIQKESMKQQTEQEKIEAQKEMNTENNKAKQSE